MSELFKNGWTIIVKYDGDKDKADLGIFVDEEDATPQKMHENLDRLLTLFRERDEALKRTPSP